MLIFSILLKNPPFIFREPRDERRSGWNHCRLSVLLSLSKYEPSRSIHRVFQQNPFSGRNNARTVGGKSYSKSREKEGVSDLRCLCKLGSTRRVLAEAPCLRMCRKSETDIWRRRWPGDLFQRGPHDRSGVGFPGWQTPRHPVHGHDSRGNRATASFYSLPTRRSSLALDAKVVESKLDRREGSEYLGRIGPSRQNSNEVCLNSFFILADVSRAVDFPFLSEGFSRSLVPWFWFPRGV